MTDRSLKESQAISQHKIKQYHSEAKKDSGVWLGQKLYIHSGYVTDEYKTFTQGNLSIDKVTLFLLCLAMLANEFANYSPQ